jgi:hypothetical protein
MIPAQQTCSPLQPTSAVTVPPLLLHLRALDTHEFPLAAQLGDPGLGSLTRLGSQTHWPAPTGALVAN